MAIHVVLLKMTLNDGAVSIARDRWQLFPLWSFLGFIGSAFATVGSVVNCTNENIIAFMHLSFFKELSSLR